MLPHSGWRCSGGSGGVDREALSGGILAGYPVDDVGIELYDGSGTITVVWLGRRAIPGIDPGRTMVVCGRLTCNTENPTIYNPKYELKPTAG